MKGKAWEGGEVEEGGGEGRKAQPCEACLRISCGLPPPAGTPETGVRLETSRMASATPEGGKPHGCQRHRLAQESASVTTFNRDSCAADLW